MQRWNGWGDTTRDATVSAGLSGLLGRALGPGTPPIDARLADVLLRLPSSRLRAGGGLCTDPQDRLRRTRAELPRPGGDAVGAGRRCPGR